MAGDQQSALAGQACFKAGLAESVPDACGVSGVSVVMFVPAFSGLGAPYSY